MTGRRLVVLPMTDEYDQLKLIDITKRYAPAEDQATADVLRGVSMVVGAGESVAIMGPSGSGKSTLLNIMGTLDRPTDGQVLLGETNLAELSDRQLAVVRNRQIGIVFQDHHLLPQCTALENVLVPTIVHSDQAQRRDAEARARRLFDRVGLSDRLHHRPGQLSGGEQQRTAVVRALVNAPRLMLADEPTGCLDQASARSLAVLLVELNREERVTLIVVTHAPDLACRMQRQFELRDGVLTPSGELP